MLGLSQGGRRALPIRRPFYEEDQVMAEAATRVKAKAGSQTASFEGKFETPKFGIPKFEFPKFELPKMEVPTAFRELAERSVTQARDGYERMKAVAEEATDVLEDTYASASKGATDYTLKTIEIARDNTNAAFDFASQLVSVKSLSEAIELTSAHTRKQLDAFIEQSKDLTAIAQRVATETSEPLKAGVGKVFKIPA